MIELLTDEYFNEHLDEPKILVIGIGGGGNNALDRMITSNIKGAKYAAINTDIQVLNACKAEQKANIVIPSFLLGVPRDR